MAPPTADEIHRRVAALLGVSEERVKPDVALSDLVGDSYRLVEMAIELQDDYDVIFSQADLSAVTTVGDLVQLVTTRAAG
jgi:acyl carrier protein